MRDTLIAPLSPLSPRPNFLPQLVRRPATVRLLTRNEVWAASSAACGENVHAGEEIGKAKLIKLSKRPSPSEIREPRGESAVKATESWNEEAEGREAETSGGGIHPRVAAWEFSWMAGMAFGGREDEGRRNFDTRRRRRRFDF